MVFSSTIFIFFFLPLVVLTYYLCPRKARNLLLLVASYLFYAWGEPRVVAILFIGSLLDYIIGQKINQSSRGSSKAKWLLSLAIALNLGALIYFKYANFFISETQPLLGSLPFFPQEWQHIALPIGISFFTFQKLSYLIDIYRSTVAPAKSFINYSLYVAFFPQLIAGPIVRYHDINLQIESRNQSFTNVSDGFSRFAIGLSKKVLLANTMAEIADSLLAQPIATLPGHYLWVAIFAYTLQIYFDFSGYSDMAIGLARMFGFTLLENFDRPYTSRTITEFWRRWHISLSNWMREYIYLPLGGNRTSSGRTYINLWIVFLVSGFWHGASWNFIIWGAMHGTLLTLERKVGRPTLQALPRWLMQPVTLLLVMLTWVFFRLETLPDAFLCIQRMFNFSTFSDFNPNLLLAESLNTRALFWMTIASLIAFTPLKATISSSLPKFKWIAAPLIHLGFVLSLLSLASSSHNPFIYFRF